MIACKVSIFFAFLFVGLFASGLSYENGTKHNSLESYGGSSCTLPEVSDRLRIILSEVEIFGGLADLDYEYTFRLVRQITGLYFSYSCGTPVFKYVYEDVSYVIINENTASSLQNGMAATMTKITQIMDNTGSIPNEDLLFALNQIALYSSMSFRFGYNYAPIQWLICNQWLALLFLGTKTPGGNQTAMEEMLKNTIDICSSQLNRREHDILAAYESADIVINEDPFSPELTLYVTYSQIDDFVHQPSCVKHPVGADCLKACDKTNAIFNFVKNPLIKTYGKVFSDGYCKMRKTFSFYNDSYNIVAAKCLDSDYYVEKDFFTLKWHAKVGQSGPISVLYDKGTRNNGGIYLRGPDQHVFLDLMNGQVLIETAVKCRKVEFLTRCEVPLPLIQGSCAA